MMMILSFNSNSFIMSFMLYLLLLNFLPIIFCQRIIEANQLELFTTRGSLGTQAMKRPNVASTAMNTFPIMKSYTAQTTTNMIILNLEFTEDGVVYGGIYTSSKSVPFISAIIAQNYAQSIDNNQTTIFFTALEAATTYYIYFYTESSSGVQMTNSAMLASRVNVTTACCRSLQINVATTTVSAAKAYANFVNVYLSSAPSSSLVLKIVLKNMATNETITTAFPDLLVDSLSESNSLNPLPSGKYAMIPVLVGSDAQSYSVVFTLQRGSTIYKQLPLTVVGSQLPAPNLQQAIFSNDGSYVAISFDAATNFGGLALNTAFTCSQLFSFACSSSSSCVWKDLKTVYAYVRGSEGCAAPRNMLQLTAAAVVKAACVSGYNCSYYDSWPKTNTSTAIVTILTASSAVAPTVIISMPNVLGQCSPLLLDFTSSTGAAGRAWKSWTVTVTATNVSSQSLSSLQTFLSQSYQWNPPSTIPADYLRSESSYEFTVRLCNFLGQCNEAQKSVTIVPKSVPVVKIIGSNSLSTTRSQSLLLISSVSLSDCSGKSSSANSAKVSYVWSVFIVTERQKSIFSSSKDPSRLLLAPYALRANQQYSIVLNVTATTGSSSASSSAAVQVSVTTGNVVAVIQGNDQQNVRVSESLILDASKSYDEDQASLKGVQAGLSFLWSCSQLKPVVNASCAEIVDIASLSNNKLTVPSLTLKALASAADRVALITVIVQDSDQSRSSVAAVTVTILSASSPTISIKSNAAFLEGTKMNAGQSLQLAATINIPSAPSTSNSLFNSSWMLSPSSQLNLGEIALTATSQVFTVISTSQTLTMYLSLPANALNSGSSYTFTLSCQGDATDSKATTSTIAIAVNAPPSDGLFDVQPRSGQEIVDPFTFSCSQWTDSDLPLTYQFSYISLSGTKIVVRSASILSYASSILPGGSKTENGSLVVLADVFDGLNANSTSSVTINVMPASAQSSQALASSFISNYLNVSFEGATSTKSVDDLMSGTAIASYLLNQANCTLAPNCTALNRKACNTKAHTCGPCLSSDLVGQSGDGNDMCYKGASVSISTKNKQCLGDCSGRGKCVFASVLSSAELSSCYEGDVSCVAKCECNSGFENSANCELSNEEVSEKMQLREQVVKGITAFVGMQDASEQAVTSWINSIHEVGQASNELSDESITALLDIAGYALNTAEGNGFSAGNTLSLLLESLDSVASAISSTASFSGEVSSRKRRLTGSTGSQGDVLMETLQNYTILVGSELAPGQKAVTSVQNNFRTYVESKETAASETKSNECLSSVALPVSALESSLNVKASSLQIPVCTSSITAVTVSVLSLSSSMYEQLDLKSDVTSLYLSSVPCADSTDCKMSVVLPTSYAEGEVGVQVEAKNVTISCKKGEYSNHTITCGDGSNYTVSCTGNADVIYGKCPEIRAKQICDGGSTLSDLGCEVLSFTEDNVTCSCPLITSQVAARRLASSLNNSSKTCEVNVAAMLASVGGSFTSTILSVNSLSEDKLGESWAVFATLGALVAAIILAMILSHYADTYTEKRVGTESNMMMHALAVQPQRGRKTQLGRKTASMIQRVDKGSEEGENVSILHLAEEALPEILSSQSFGKRVWKEVKRNHRWLGVVFYFSSKFPRILRVVSLATNIIVMLFIQSLTYSFTNGDDGSCEDIKMEQDCLDEPSAYGMGQSKCYWTAGDQTCHYVQPNDSMQIILFVAIFSALACSPIALTADWVIQNILAAPTRDEKVQAVKVIAAEKLHDEKDIHVMGQFVSFERDVLRNERVKAIAREEFYEMKKELINYRKMLTIEERKDFNETWGLTEEGNFRNEEILTLSEVRAKDEEITFRSEGSSNSFMRRFSTFLSRRRSRANSSTSSFLMAKDKMKSVAVLLQREMEILHMNLKKEQIRFNTKKNNSNTERMRNKRLLFLFQRDLMPGIQGEILEMKDKRDNEVLPEVSIQSKYAAWLFLGVLNCGMLFYVFLFAAQQDAARQAAWGRSFAVWLVLEVGLVSTGICLFMHILLPSILLRNVFQVKRKLMESIAKYHENIQQQQFPQSPKSLYSTASTASTSSKSHRATVVTTPKSKRDPDLLPLHEAVDDEDTEEEEEEEGKEESESIPTKSHGRSSLIRPSDLLKQKKKAKNSASTPTSSSFTLAAPPVLTAAQNAGYFNAARYLFVSYRLASIYPESKVAKIILQFQTPWPRQSYQYINDVSKKYNKRFAAFIRSGSLIIVFLLTNFISMPLSIQDLVMSLSITSIISYYFYLHIQLYEINPFLAVLPDVFFVGFLFFLYKMYRHYRSKVVIETPEEVFLNGQNSRNTTEVTITKNETRMSRVEQERNIRRTRISRGLPTATPVVAPAPLPNQPQRHVTRRLSVQQGVVLLQDMVDEVDQDFVREKEDSELPVFEEMEEGKDDDQELDFFEEEEDEYPVNIYDDKNFDNEERYAYGDENEDKVKDKVYYDDNDYGNYRDKYDEKDDRYDLLDDGLEDEELEDWNLSDLNDDELLVDPEGGEEASKLSSDVEIEFKP